MDKKEKYINYIVDDLVSKTEINDDVWGVKFPFSGNDFNRRSNTHHFFYMNTSPRNFFVHIQKKYGVRKEESDIIWEQYKIRIGCIIWK